MSKFRFEFNDEVMIDVSAETGRVVGRAEYPTAECTYLVRYKSADGRAVESWWGESALSNA